MANQRSTVSEIGSRDSLFLETLREGMQEFDTIHLIKLRNLIYDRWNWETGSKQDKEWMEVANEILEERGVDNKNGGINIKSTDDGKMEVIAKGINITDPFAPGLNNPILEVNGGTVSIGWALEQALRDFIVKELHNGTTMTANNGMTTKQVIEDIAKNAIRNELI